MCIKSMRMIIPHNTVLTAGVNAVCAPYPRPSEGLLTHSGAPGGGVGGRVLDTVEADVQINTWHVSTVGIYWQTQTR